MIPLTDTFPSTVHLLQGALFAALLAYLSLYIRGSHVLGKGLRLPPGPKPLPILGNLLDMPTKHETETFLKWKELYGDVVFVKLLHRPMIIVNTFAAATQLMEGKFPIYSDRPRFPLIDVIGHQWNFGFKPFGEEYLSLRRMFLGQYANPTAVKHFYGSMGEATGHMLRNLSKDPENFSDHVTLRSNQVITDITYGHIIESANDTFIALSDAVMHQVSLALSPAIWIVDPISVVQFFTSWFGGVTSLPPVRRWRQTLEDFRNLPFESTKAKIAQGTARPCVVASLLQEINKSDILAENTIRDAAAVSFGGASETSIAGGLAFFLAMVVNPEAQTKAQEEIDRVTGGDRLPRHTDRNEMPYVTALVKEVFRFPSIVPVGIPRMCKEENEYNGYMIPRGSIVVLNTGAIVQDPTIYPDPHTFNPDRFIHDGKIDFRDTIDPSRIIFGVGKRICPGRLLAEDSLWLMVAQVLAVYRLLPVDEKNPPPLNFEHGAVSRPAPFKCIVRPRSEAAKVLIENAV